MTQKYTKCLAKLKDLEVEKKNSKNVKLLSNIFQDAKNNDEKVVLGFL
jgi:hypothetical protein